MKTATFIGRSVLVLLTATFLATTNSTPADAAQPDDSERIVPDAVETMREAALTFLESLSPEARDKATFSFDDQERRAWSNLPHTMFERKGLRFGEMTPQQQLLGYRLLDSALRSQGYLKVTGIMQLDEILVELARARGRDDPPFGKGYYWLGFFGDPANDVSWGWQLDGHHLALNFTVVGDIVSVTPAFLGTDPAEVREGPHAGWRVLSDEDDRGRALLESLSDEQHAQALIAKKAPRDVITGPGRGDGLTEITGLSAAAMNPEQRAILLRLIWVYLQNFEDGVSGDTVTRMSEAGLDAISFAWMGTTPGEPYYYRIHGPSLLIEFDNSYPPGSDSGPINHIHTVLRDPENDYGEDLLRKHYETRPHHR